MVNPSDNGQGRHFASNLFKTEMVLKPVNLNSLQGIESSKRKLMSQLIQQRGC